MPLLPDPVASAAPAAALTVQEPEGPGKKGKQARHVGPDTPVAGLDNADQSRRAFARRWGKKYGGNGAVYPDHPAGDRSIILELLQYHARAKVPGKWQDWMLDVFNAYLGIDDDRLVVQNVHALRFLHGCMPRVVAKVAEDAAQRPQEDGRE